MEQAVSTNSVENGSVASPPISVLRFVDIYPDCCQQGNLLVQYAIGMREDEAGRFYLVAAKHAEAAIVAQAISFCPFCGAKVPTELVAELMTEESEPYLPPVQHTEDPTDPTASLPEPESLIEPPSEEELNDGLLQMPEDEVSDSGEGDQAPADESQVSDSISPEGSEQ